MIHIIAETIEHALMITGFVFVMMLVLEYANVLSRGRWDASFQRLSFAQLVLAAVLGASPGCLGAFVVVSMYVHRVVSIGAVLAALTASVGDETFVMLALFPGKTVVILACTTGIGIAIGVIADVLLKRRRTRADHHPAEYTAIHEHEDTGVCFSRAGIAAQWRKCSAQRGWLTAFLLFFVLGIATGHIGHDDMGLISGAGHHHGWDWVRLTQLLLGATGLFIVATVPDHFLEEHLWGHLVKVHAWRIFLWTVGALAAVNVILNHLNIEGWLSDNRLPMLAIACAVGVIPQSGPHLLFVTLYAQGNLPFSILLANSIVQDGHGAIPLLAHSRRAFVFVKAVKLAIGAGIGLAGYFMGW